MAYRHMFICDKCGEESEIDKDFGAPFGLKISLGTRCGPKFAVGHGGHQRRQEGILAAGFCSFRCLKQYVVNSGIYVVSATRHADKQRFIAWNKIDTITDGGLRPLEEYDG